MAIRVYRVAPEHIRTLSEREQQNHLGQIKHSPGEEPPNLRGQGVFQYHDLVDNAGLEVPHHHQHIPEPHPTNQPESEASLPPQPDNEPSIVTGSNNSEMYAPSTPQSLLPLDDGIQVPVPDESDEDELEMEDYLDHTARTSHSCAQSTPKETFLTMGR